MEWIIASCSLPLLKYIVLMAFLNFVVHIIAHIKSKTYDYRKSTDFLFKLAGYLIVVFVFSILTCASSDAQIFIFSNLTLNMVCLLILVKYARDILDGLMIWGVDVANFIPFLRNAQHLIRVECGMDTIDGRHSAPIVDNKNVW